MTRKDYVKIAGVIKKHICSWDSDRVEDLTQDLAVMFASDNPRFDQDRFLEACGL